jgi:hypothetical protein
LAIVSDGEASSQNDCNDDEFDYDEFDDDDNDNDDDDWVDDDDEVDDDDDDNPESNKASGERLRLRNISIPGHEKVLRILTNLGFYKYLRLPFGVVHSNSVQDSNQILRRSACVIAFFLTDIDNIIKVEVICIMICLLSPNGHSCLHSYIQHLAALGYKPLTLHNTVEYVRHLLTWANRSLPQCSKPPCDLSSFRIFATEIASKVMHHMISFHLHK